MYNDRVPTCIPRSANADLKYLPCEISRLPAVISEGSRDGETPLVFNKVVDIGLCKCRSYNWRIQNEVVKATQNHCERRGVDTLLLLQLTTSVHYD